MKQKHETVFVKRMKQKHEIVLKNMKQKTRNSFYKTHETKKIQQFL